MRLFRLLTVLLLAMLTLSACNPEEEKKEGSESSNNGTDGTTNSADSSPIKMGFCFEETGDAATFGISSRKGAEMAIDEINQAGGIDGQRQQRQDDDRHRAGAQPEIDHGMTRMQ